MKVFLIIAAVSTVASAQLLNNLLPILPGQTISSYNNQLLNWVQNVLNVLGANSIIDGPPNTNQRGPLQGPLRSISPTSQEARHYVNLAGAAYCPRNLETWTCPLCLAGYTYKGQLTDNTYQTLVYFAVSEERKEIIVAYRGTQNGMNYVLDAVPVPVPIDSNSTTDDGIKLHLGFKLLTDSLYPQVLIKLQSLISEYPSNYKIVFTGHSLGAAQASISVFYLYHSNSEIADNKVIELLTYGCPRVGNREFADFMNNLSIKIGRVVERADLAVRFFPAAMNYYHFQNEIWIYKMENNGTDRTNCSKTVYEDSNCSSSLGPLYTFVDHFTYYHVDLMIWYAIQDVAIVALDFIAPFKQYIPPGLLASIPILPIGESGITAEIVRKLSQFLG